MWVQSHSNKIGLLRKVAKTIDVKHAFTYFNLKAVSGLGLGKYQEGVS
jgi:hypothetical protein